MLLLFLVSFLIRLMIFPLNDEVCPINPCMMKYIYIVECFSSNIPIGGEKICVGDHMVMTEVTATVVAMAAAVVLY
jgi:hypothetical protein